MKTKSHTILAALTLLVSLWTMANGNWSLAEEGGLEESVRVDRDCFGDTVDVYLVDQPSGEPKVLLHLPVDARPIVYPSRSRKPVLSESGCAQEPIYSRSVYFNPGHLRDLNAAIGFDEDEPTVRRFEIYPGKGISRSVYEKKSERASRAAAEGKTELTPEGFTRLNPSGGDSGEYIAPQTYVEPSGYPLQFFCFPSVSGSECNIQYWLPGDVVVNYWFLTSSVEPRDWTKLDKAMRRVVTGLLDSNYLEQWQDTTGGVL